MRGRRRALLALVLSQCSADARRSPLSLPLSSKAHALQLRGGTATATSTAAATTPATTPTSVKKKKHAYITPRELTQIMVADLAPRGMLPLAWAATRGAGRASCRRTAPGGACVVFGIRCIYSSPRPVKARRAAGSQSCGAGRNYPCQRPWTPVALRWRVLRVLCGLCCGPVLRFGEALGSRHVEMVLGANLYTARTNMLGDDGVLGTRRSPGCWELRTRPPSANGVTSDVAPIPATQTCSVVRPIRWWWPSSATTTRSYHRGYRCGGRRMFRRAVRGGVRFLAFARSARSRRWRGGHDLQWHLADATLWERHTTKPRRSSAARAHGIVFAATLLGGARPLIERAAERAE